MLGRYTYRGRKEAERKQPVRRSSGALIVDSVEFKEERDGMSGVNTVVNPATIFNPSRWSPSEDAMEVVQSRIERHVKEDILAILQVNVRPATRFRRIAEFAERDTTKNSSDSHSNGAELHEESSSSDSQTQSTVIINQLPSSGVQSAPIWQRIVWTLMPGTTVGRAIVSATQRLEEAGSATAHLDAQVILAHVLQVDRGWLFAHYDTKLNPAETSAYTEQVARRIDSEPVAYIVGRKEFYGLDLEVDRRVLIPRPETELLVDAVLDHIASRPDPRVRMADVGTGSGAIALAVAANCPDAEIFAIELSDDAIDVARNNVQRLDGRQQVHVLQGDLLTPLSGKVDIIAANLPYVTSQDYDTLDADIRDYEPQLALEAGPEGLDAIRRLLEMAPSYLNPGGVIYLEIGHDQGEAVLEMAKAMIPEALYVGVRQDYHGQDRLVVIAV